MISALPAYRANRQSAADDLAEDRKIRFAAKAGGPALVANAKADHLIGNEHDAVVARNLAQEREKVVLGQRKAGAVAERVVKQRRYFCTVLFEQAGHGFTIVVRQRQHVGFNRVGQSAAAGHAVGGVRRAPRVRLRGIADLYVVVVTVVEALEFGNPAASRECARQLDRQHHGLGTGIRKANLFQSWDAGYEQTGKVELRLRRFGKGRAALQLIDDGVVNYRVGMAVDQRGHVVEVVDALDALDVGQVAAVTGLGIYWVRLIVVVEP